MYWCYFGEAKNIYLSLKNWMNTASSYKNLSMILINISTQCLCPCMCTLHCDWSCLFVFASAYIHCIIHFTIKFTSFEWTNSFCSTEKKSNSKRGKRRRRKNNKERSNEIEQKKNAMNIFIIIVSDCYFVDSHIHI